VTGVQYFVQQSKASVLQAKLKTQMATRYRSVVEPRKAEALTRESRTFSGASDVPFHLECPPATAGYLHPTTCYRKLIELLLVTSHKAPNISC
jgi:hypothetical protein